MKPSPGVWGIDLGQCALKAIRLQEVEGVLTATAFDYVEYPKILSQPDADPDQLTREALEQFLSRNSLRGDTVAIAVPGQSGLARFVKLPPVEEKKIADIVKFEAKQQIPFNLDEVVWDFQKLGASNVVDGFALETEIGLFAMKRDMVNKYLQHFKDVGVEVHVIQMAPLALCNYVAFDLLAKDPGSPAEEGKKTSVVALDIGADSSNLVITDGAKVIWQRPIPLGGNHFTRALTKDMKLTFAKAEHLKRNATKSGAAELKKILASLKPVLNDFVGEVQRSLGFFSNTHRDASIEYMVGLGNAFRLPGLQRFLAEKLQLEVRKLEKMARVSGDVLNSPIFHDNILSFAVAYGLAVQGLNRGKLITNLLPGEIRMERLIRSKKPWAVAAAGLLLLGLGGMAWGSYLDERPYSAQPVLDAIATANKVAATAKSMDDAFTAARTKALAEEEAVKAIVAGQAEQLNWIKFTQFLSNCIPQPDGSNLPPDQVATYMNSKPDVPGRRTHTGKEAYKLYEDRLREGARPAGEESRESDPLPPGVDDLVQFHIESVSSRFCDDLPAFWKAAAQDGKHTEGDVRPLSHWRKSPDGVGWVVEVAGYTYHRGQAAFVRDTLLANIARMGVQVDASPAAGATPGTTPAAGAPASAPKPAVPSAKPTGPVRADFAAAKVPVVGHISHVLLYRSIAKPASEAGGFEFIGSGLLGPLVAPAESATGAGSTAGAPGAPGVPGMTRPGAGTPASPTGPARADRSGWAALSSRGDADGGGAGRAGAGLPGGVGPGNPAAGGKEPAAGAGNHKRTEFVILFIWQEPTPSDSLRVSAPAAPGAAAKR
jgi:type IV pilus assembly protein PilM